MKKLLIILLLQIRSSLLNRVYLGFSLNFGKSSEKKIIIFLSTFNEQQFLGQLSQYLKLAWAYNQTTKPI